LASVQQELANLGIAYNFESLELAYNLAPEEPTPQPNPDEPTQGNDYYDENGVHEHEYGQVQANETHLETACDGSGDKDSDDSDGLEDQDLTDPVPHNTQSLKSDSDGLEGQDLTEDPVPHNTQSLKSDSDGLEDQDLTEDPVPHHTQSLKSETGGSDGSDDDSIPNTQEIMESSITFRDVKGLTDGNAAGSSSGDVVTMEFMGPRKRKHESADDKERRIVELKTAMQTSLVMMAQGEAVASIVEVGQRTEALRADTEHDPMKLKRLIDDMNDADVKTLLRAIIDSNNVTHRSGTIAKLLFGPRLEPLQALESRIHSSRQATRHVAEFMVASAFVEDGSSTVDWVALRDYCLKRIGGDAVM
jgi:hypothetical protein